MKPTAPGMLMPCGCTSPLPNPHGPVKSNDIAHGDAGSVPTLCLSCHHPIVEAGPYAETRRLRREFEDFAVATPEDTDA